MIYAGINQICIDYSKLKTVGMKKFVVERNLPGAGNFTPDELRSLSQVSCESIVKLGKLHYWIKSYITNDKIYCIHIAENEEMIREHAKLGKIPVNMISEVKAIIDPANSSI